MGENPSRGEILKTSLKGDLLTRRNGILAVGAVALGVLGLFGGFGPAPEDDIQVVGPGEKISTAQMDIEVGEVTGEGLEMTITNKAHMPIGDFVSTPMLQWAPEAGLDFVTPMREGSYSVSLSPNVPTDIVIFLPESGSGTLELFEFTFRESNLDNNRDWFDPVKVGEVVIP